MCHPAVAVGLAIGQVAVAGMQAQVTHKAKQIEYASKSAAWQQNVVNAEAASRDEQRQIITRQLQEQSKFVQKRHLSYMEEAQKSATAEVSAAAGGVGGISVDNLIGDIISKSSMNRGYMEENYKWVVADTTEQLHATDTRMKSRIASVERPTQPADTRGIEILGAAISAGSKLAGSKYVGM
jgi:hypothetical protein